MLTPQKCQGNDADYNVAYSGCKRTACYREACIPCLQGTRTEHYQGQSGGPEGKPSRQVAMVMASTASYGFDSVDVGVVFYVYVGVFAN